MLYVAFRGFGCVMVGVLVVPVSKMRMVTRLLMISGFMVLRGVFVMASGVFMVFRCFSMVIGDVL
jgi:hypothetical protein